MNSKTIVFNLNNIDRVAKIICSKLNTTNILFLNGCLGSGKTTLVKHIVQELGGDHNEVTSPTFNLLHVYSALKHDVYHYDLYRLKYKNELVNLGIEDVISAGIVIVEWGSILRKILSCYDYINVDINLCEQESYRKIIIKYKF